MKSNYVCLHGHFYQPPRENPFTGAIQDQPSALPFANWNERITAEAYAPNLSARVLGESGTEVARVNNYAWTSYDFGPTLLAWLEAHAPETYSGIIESDRQSASNLGGHGSAMAQSYNHTILPLANSADKHTQIKWGVADFEHRFGRFPTGMWLPETAVDRETLSLLAAEGIEFTVLSPYQAGSVLGPDGVVADVRDGSVDTTVPYIVEPSPRTRLAVFFYNGPLSQEIAFDGLLDDGRKLAARLVDSIGDVSAGPALANVATDGETYGHHHRFGEMALAAAVEELRGDPKTQLTNYRAYLDVQSPRARVEVIEDSSWSCAHGVERWRSDCGCSTGGEEGWNQAWRAPLRSAFDWLRDAVAVRFEASRGRLFADPWAARDAYIQVVLGRPGAEFMAEFGAPGIDAAAQAEALGLLEIQKSAMLMYTSCGWFFNDLAGIETIFVLRHAGMVVQLAREHAGTDLEPELLSRLEAAVSNRGGLTGRDIYATEVAPFLIDWWSVS